MQDGPTDKLLCNSCSNYAKDKKGTFWSIVRADHGEALDLQIPSTLAVSLEQE